jgi:hypothetical protein
MQPDERTLREFEKLGIEPPSIVSHGVTADEIERNMVRAEMTNWRLDGNQLLCDTQFGPMSQTINPSYILKGTDADGMPILVKVA